MCLCVLVCVNFRDEILLRGEECKTHENGKIVISVENRKFSRPWMTKWTSPLNLSRKI